MLSEMAMHGVPGSLVGNGCGNPPVKDSVAVQEPRFEPDFDGDAIPVLSDNSRSQCIFKGHLWIMEEKMTNCRYNTK